MSASLSILDEYDIKPSFENYFRNVSKYNYCFSDFPFPDDVADYPHNTVMADYIEDYVKHFNVGENIRFMRKVLNIVKTGMSSKPMILTLLPSTSKNQYLSAKHVSRTPEY